MDWTAPRVDRHLPETTGAERAMLERFLDFHRDTLLRKCTGLDEAQLKTAAAAPSGLSLLGLVRHLTDVEYWWFSDNVAGRRDYPSYRTAERPDAAFEEAAGADPEQAFAAHRAAVAASKAATAPRNLEDTFEHPHGGPGSVRWAYLHMIEEYARHNGHADLLRERIDGVAGQ